MPFATERGGGMRVLHGPMNIGNQAWTLSRAERRLGIASDLVVTSGNWLDYPADRILEPADVGARRRRLRRAAFGLSAPLRYDVLHYYFGATFLDWERTGARLGLRGRVLRPDLLLARRLGRKVFMTLQGCDVRLAGESNRRNAWTMCAEGRCSSYRGCLDWQDAARQRLIAEVLPLCDRVFYLNPELGHALPAGQFLPYASVDIHACRPEPPAPGGRPRLLHAPSSAAIKGTPMILAALDRLRSRFDFELVLIEGRRHEEAMELYRTADLAIDQVLAGWYGGFAVEMMAMGKPVACTIREEDLLFVPGEMRAELPVLRVRPDHLAEDLAALLERRDAWPEIGARSRRFVERWHDPDRIAGAMVAAYANPESAFDLT
jgi:hypothetical protein